MSIIEYIVEIEVDEETTKDELEELLADFEEEVAKAGFALNDSSWDVIS